MKKRQIDQSNLDIEFKQDYLNIDKTVAISSEGVIFKIGDKIIHEGDHERKVHTIKSFTIDIQSKDVLATNESGCGRISFLSLFAIKK